MKINVSTDDLDKLMKELEGMSHAAKRNLNAAIVDTATEAREVLVKATVSPRDNRWLKDIAIKWVVVRTPNGAAVVNAHEHAAYLEWGTGIYNEGPGHKGLIYPRQMRHSAWAARYREKTGKEPPKILSWIDPVTKERVFARYVKGMKPVRMVRDNMPELLRILEENVNLAVVRTAEGRPYG